MQGRKRLGGAGQQTDRRPHSRLEAGEGEEEVR
jgi:hypothetical protein